MSKHTPTPWEHNGFLEIISKKVNPHDEQIIASLTYSDFETDECKANAARIVECVNALDGVEEPEKFLEELPFKIIELGNLKMQACIERDRLLDALRGMTEAFTSACLTNEQVEAWNDANQLLIDTAKSTEPAEAPTKAPNTDKWEDQEGDVHP